MNAKTRLIVGITFLFILIAAMGVISIYYIRLLAGDTDKIIKDNQQSIDYVEHMNVDIERLEYYAMNSLTSDIAGKRIVMSKTENEFLFSDFNKAIDSEASNITEIGEEDAVKKLKTDFQNYKTAFYSIETGNMIPDNILFPYRTLLSDLNTIYELNKKAILEKNVLESKSASNGVFCVTLLGSVFILVAFVFIMSFPGKSTV